MLPFTSLIPNIPELDSTSTLPSSPTRRSLHTPAVSQRFLTVQAGLLQRNAVLLRSESFLLLPVWLRHLRLQVRFMALRELRTTLRCCLAARKLVIRNFRYQVSHTTSEASVQS